MLKTPQNNDSGTNVSFDQSGAESQLDESTWSEHKLIHSSVQVAGDNRLPTNVSSSQTMAVHRTDASTQTETMTVDSQCQVGDTNEEEKNKMACSNHQPEVVNPEVTDCPLCAAAANSSGQPSSEQDVLEITNHIPLEYDEPTRPGESQGSPSEATGTSAPGQRRPGVASCRIPIDENATRVCMPLGSQLNGEFMFTFNLADVVRRQAAALPDGHAQVTMNFRVSSNVVVSPDGRVIASGGDMSVATSSGCDGREMDAQAVDREWLDGLGLDSSVVSDRFEHDPYIITDLEVYDSKYRRLMPGDIIVLAMGLYSRHGIYVGNGFMVHLSSNFATCDKLFEVSQGCPFFQHNILDNRYRPKPNREIVLRALSRIRSSQMRNGEKFVTWCRYGREHVFEDNPLAKKLCRSLGF